MHGVAEGAPGVTLDKYGSTLLVQSWRNPIVGSGATRTAHTHSETTCAFEPLT